MRVGLDGVVDLGVGQGPGEGIVVVAHDVEVEHQAGPFLFAVLKELADAIGHCSCIPSGQSANGCTICGTARYAAAARLMQPSAAMVWIGDAPRSAPGKKDKPLRTSGIRAGNPKKPDPSLL